MSYHAVLSPSSAHRWMRCAGSVALERGLPNDSNEYSDEGTAAHDLAAMCLREGSDAVAYLGRIITVDHDDQPSRHFTVDDDFAVAVQKYVGAVREYLKGSGEGAELLIEQSLPVGRVTGEEGATGTGDAIILDYASKEIQVHDLKFGKGVRVDADENEQEMLYALGALYNASLFGEWDRIRLVIHQPRIEHLSEWICSIVELHEFAKHAGERASHALATLTEKPGAIIHHLNPGEKQCRFCRAKATCPKLAHTVAEQVFGDFEALDRPITQVAVPAKEIPNDQLGNYLAKVALIQEWCRAVLARGEAEMLSGNKVTGWKVVAGKRGNRAWSDATEAETVLKSFRLKREQMYDFSLISPTSAEKVLKAKPKRWAKVLPLITQSAGNPSVVPETDKRPAIEITPPANDFANLEEELL